ncbi:hypothetical protein HF086_009676 [Spodoptera exigua]|uniref:Uncharacterized protein n=1 Tax=Spodoptera exigua TaxID=7107 RepID=A0A922MT24_SPOEX|nr:hypothetical protein HF086_009676 [Spodoptera exigua]
MSTQKILTIMYEQLPKIHGNAGFGDHVTFLRWVQPNTSDFDGDLTDVKLLIHFYNSWASTPRTPLEDHLNNNTVFQYERGLPVGEDEQSELERIVDID